MNKVPFLRRYLSMTVAAMLLLAPLRLPAEPPAGQDGDSAALRTQVEALREAVQAMQKRLDAIEGQLGDGAPLSAAPATALPNATAPVPPKPKAPAPAANSTSSQPRTPATGSTTTGTSARTLTPRIVESWDGLHAGMEPADVRALLGEPSRRFALSGQPVWYYYYTGVGGGSVMFSRGDGKVMSWQRPPFHAWW